MEISFIEFTEIYAYDILKIINYYIETGFAAYNEKRAGMEFINKMAGLSSVYPVIIILDGSEAVGFGILQPVHSAETLRRCAQIGYFIRHDYTGKGLGKQLLGELITKAKEIGIDSLMAHISSENTGSINFHQRNGFTDAGRFVKAGRKWGKDFDLIWMQKFI